MVSPIPICLAGCVKDTRLRPLLIWTISQGCVCSEQPWKMRLHLPLQQRACVLWTPGSVFPSCDRSTVCIDLGQLGPASRTWGAGGLAVPILPAVPWIIKFFVKKKSTGLWHREGFHKKMKSKTLKAKNDKMNYVKYSNLCLIRYKKQSEKVFVTECEIAETKITDIRSLCSILRKLLKDKKINKNNSI